MKTKQKLELTWIGKHKRSRLESRILLEDKLETSLGSRKSIQALDALNKIEKSLITNKGDCSGFLPSRDISTSLSCEKLRNFYFVMYINILHVFFALS